MAKKGKGKPIKKEQPVIPGDEVVEQAEQPAIPEENIINKTGNINITEA